MCVTAYIASSGFAIGVTTHMIWYLIINNGFRLPSRLLWWTQEQWSSLKCFVHLLTVILTILYHILLLMLLPLSVILRTRQYPFGRSFYRSFDRSRWCPSTMLSVFHTVVRTQHECRLWRHFITAASVIIAHSATITKSSDILKILMSCLGCWPFSHLFWVAWLLCCWYGRFCCCDWQRSHLGRFCPG